MRNVETGILCGKRQKLVNGFLTAFWRHFFGFSSAHVFVTNKREELMRTNEDDKSIEDSVFGRKKEEKVISEEEETKN